MEKKLVKSNNKMLAGVCGGIGEYFNIDPTLVRVIYVILSLFTTGFPGLLLYLILCLVMPNADGSNTIDNLNNQNNTPSNKD